MSTATPNPAAKMSNQSDTLLSFGLLAILVVMLVPLPTALLDMLIAFNLGVTVLLMLVTLNAKQALDLSVFPSLLLLLTLYRLSLNVATTRLILLDGDAGRIVSTFGNFVVGGNLIVGLVIFLILVIIQFVVITKGASRVSEVAARFTLDAMPGKQMAIDAELNAGAINETEARRRRDLLTRETEFYGGMDGASKFVRGDAIAGLIITAINLVGGVALGLTNGMTFADSLRNYAVLSVGDGLISQIPALIIATTAGILSTKANSATSLGQEIGDQMFRHERSLIVGAVIVAAMALTPGLPKLPFLALAGGLWWRVARGRKAKAEPVKEPVQEKTAEVREIEHLQEFLITDRAIIEVGTRLIPFVNNKQGKSVTEQITSLRRDFSRTNGIWIPPVRVINSVELEPETYRVLIAGRTVAKATIRVDMVMAIAPDDRPIPVPGEDTREPAFNLPARWIATESQRLAEIHGCTVVDPASVLVTHLGEVLKRHGHELISREDVKKMIDTVKAFAPTVVEELKPDVVRMAVLHQVLVLLAAERVALADLVLILESVLNHGPQIKVPEDLADRVREDLGRLICDRYRDDGGSLRVVILDPRLEKQLRDSIREKQLALAPQPLEKLLGSLSAQVQNAQRQQLPLAVLIDKTLRRPLRRLLVRAAPDLGVISYQEVPPDIMLQTVTMLKLEDVFPAAPGDAARAPNPLADLMAA
ncbi:flagellar biosynthesis protein FlhA [Planctomyces sp. SH-PL14]|uniref:flagellar biosynthesis protein FlhA n=1 Tax=Planctomyces sp. SH-PL14 TaxID=1632864 RepID=UPI00078DF3BC|nr:flagellar biosynthesis protein FlhA [Planctomyces sp. SH-PL14]AMV21589.1 Flagellar biosynthesis protein FlhA [Planctomyces sp. SH-PL14]